MKFRVPTRIETKRLVLRKPKMEDANPIFNAYANDPKIPYYMSWTSHRDIGQTEEFIKVCIDDWELGKNFEFVIEVRENGASPVGMIGMHPLSSRHSSFGFGYVIAEKFWNRGYVSEALETLANWALNQEHVFRVQAFCDVDNKASARVMEKSGMQYEGRLKRYFVHPNISPEPRDSLMYAKTC